MSLVKASAWWCHFSFVTPAPPGKQGGGGVVRGHTFYRIKMYEIINSPVEMKWRITSNTNVPPVLCVHMLVECSATIDNKFDVFR